jgi:hypothetical protein
MTDSNHRQVQKAIDAHFKGRGNAASHALFMAHLPSCKKCHGYFERRQMLADVDPAALTAEQRIGASIGIVPAPKSRAVGVPAFFTAAAMAMGALVIWPNMNTSSEFQSRGAGDKTTVVSPSEEVFVHIMGAKDEPVLLQDEMKASAEIAFSYRNKGAFTHLMIYGVDEKNEVYWYYPSWTDPEKNPAAIRVLSNQEVNPLENAVAHEYRGKRLRLYSLFLKKKDATLTVQQLEAHLKTRALDAGLFTPGPKLIGEVKLIP